MFRLLSMVGEVLKRRVAFRHVFWVLCGILRHTVMLPQRTRHLEKGQDWRLRLCEQARVVWLYVAEMKVQIATACSCHI